MPLSKLLSGALLRGSGQLAKLTAGIRANSDLHRTGAGLIRGPNQGLRLNAAAWSNTWPAPGATLDLDFANNRGFVRGVGQGGVMDAITFTRASIGKYVDSSGIVQDAPINAPRFDWASTAQVAVKNLLTNTEDLSSTTWTKVNAPVTANATTDPLGGPTADLITPATNTAFHYVAPAANSNVSGLYVYSVYAKANGYNRFGLWDSFSSRFNVVFDLSSGTIVAGSGGTITSEGNGWYRCSVAFTATGATMSFSAVPLPNTATTSNTQYAGDGVSGTYIWGEQFESGASVTAYQAVGAQVPTNTPLAAAPTCNGLLIEESRTNRLLWCRDATNAAWAKTNVTAAKDQTGIDGVANAASSLTASADGGTCIQTITLASGSRTGSVYLKRITGTGNVQVSLDGSTWSTVELSSTEWRRIVLSGTVTNPTVGVLIATSGDAVAMDYGQVEDGAFATSPVLTTTASATRSADVASITSATAVPVDRITVYARIQSNDTGDFGVFLTNMNNIGVSPLGIVRFNTLSGSNNAQSNFGVSTLSAFSKTKVCVSQNKNNYLYTDSGKAAAERNYLTASTNPQMSFRLGFDNNIGYLNGCMEQFKAYPFQLSAKAMEEITR
jgi:hypothetical protein